MVKRDKKHDRDDKYYKLAKAQGYRSRAAFKLTQLNKQYGFLEKSRVLIDLCAAPGGWCQVASKYMPMGSTIIGLDLLPIRRIPGVVTYEKKNGGDITSPLCRSVLKKHIGGSNADVVLCDGAPDVGGAWSKDAYGQSELALVACKLATEFLKRGGIFITKVFRSGDYNALLWVFQRLFKRVDSMKPSSSRSSSAEIFVVCRDYLAPDRIDPRLLDPKYAFKQVEEAKKAPDVLHKKVKHKRNREGYDESLGQTLYAECTISEFINADAPQFLGMLGQYNRMLFDEHAKRWLDHKATTDDIRSCFADLKVLGKADYKNLLKWRYVMRHIVDKERRAEAGAAADAPAPPADAEAADEGATKKLTKEEEMVERLRRKAKREKKREREKKIKYQRRVDLGIEPGTAVDRVQDDEIFSTRQVKDTEDIRSSTLNASDSDGGSSGAEAGYLSGEDYTATLEENLDYLYSTFKSTKEKRGAMPTVITSKGQTMTKRKRAMMEEYLKEKKEKEEYENSEERQKERAADYFKLLSKGMSDESDDADTDDEDGDSEAEEIQRKIKLKRKELAAKERGVEIAPEARAARWFSNPAFGENGMGESDSDARSSSDDDEEEGGGGSADEYHPTKEVLEIGEMPKTDKQIRKERRKRLSERNERREQKRRKKSKLEFDIVASNNDGETETPEEAEARERLEKTKDMIKAGMGSALEAKESKKAFETVPQFANVGGGNFDTDENNGDAAESSDDDQRAHTLALGQFMLRHSTAKDFVDASYHRYAWNDPEDLPPWFVEEEKEHNQPQLPVTKQMVLEAKRRLRRLNEAPIKKVAEARARKKERSSRRMEKAKKLAEKIVDDDQLTARTKMRAIAKAMAKTKTPRPGSVHVVVRKGGKSTVAKGGGKPKVKFVDRRMRADERGLQQKAKGHKRRKKGQKRGGRRR
jgi:AdoMet-dependent rRNA methyltransferase SPB1